ncbi:shikimate dehydrogenase [Enterobacteriaceae endosymbiont of Donacia bicoloricornis]|uniref:shikimate dehydrogenase n=1 Tax=Enterobacteriaceae endosymbiont of Donacia bicoloricornis TaxID=2675772 RepID=UPI001448E2B0|nr:shikimate dehydrogenase [Enterobacteriaceae endosymbiont of Donacia bicoloricornis]QJC37767.1 shikimate dehydrogenase [Enterobacteriaceae endosymbiont of Donacia bicoloricornis]
MNIFAVLGNPVKHSKSPIIHQLFAKQTGILHNYKKICIPLNNFYKSFFHFFKNGGIGANITVPFKKKAYKLCDFVTKRAKYSGVVNTIKIINSKKILGDNTDGIGLLKDLQNLKFINSKSNILLIGAGGAAQGIIYPLINFGCNITIINRTYQNTKKIVKFFKNIKNINYLKLEDLFIFYNKFRYNLIINATSSSIKGNIPNIPSNIIGPDVFCYDLFYNSNNTPFLKWCIINGAKKVSDGIGMLIEQAAHSFYLWHGIMPNTKLIIKKYKKYD